MSRLIAITLDDSALPPPTPEFEQERRVALYDLLEDNSFALPHKVESAGPFRLALAIREQRLAFTICEENGSPTAEFHLALGPFRQVIKDYFQICDSYFAAVKTMPAAQIEAIDMARRGIHNEGALVLQERLRGKCTLDKDTARRLFTLVCVLQRVERA